MILSDLITDSYRAYRGKSSSVPAAGTAKYIDILAIANRKQREWATDSNVDWPSRYEMRASGSLTTGKQAYDVDDDILRLSDYVILTDSSGNKTYVGVVKPQAQSLYSTGCYISGFNPQQVTFITTISSSYNGRTLTLPCFTQPDDLVNPSDVVAVENPQWLVYAVAAELARNDYARVAQYPNLIGQANDLYQKMVDNAQNSSFLQPNGAENNMSQPIGWLY